MAAAIDRIGQVAVEVDPEDVLPGALSARARFELAHVEPVRGDDPQDRQQRAWLVADGDDQRRAPIRRRVDERRRRAVGPREDEEARPVAGQIADVVRERFQPEQGRRAWRQDGGRATLVRVRDGLPGTGGVVGRQELPAARTEERLRLAEGLDVRVDALDVVEALAG